MSFLTSVTLKCHKTRLRVMNSLSFAYAALFWYRYWYHFAIQQYAYVQYIKRKYLHI